MRFTIEVLRSTQGNEVVLTRESVLALTQFGARKKALRLLEQWQRRGATAVRLRNSSGDESYFMTSASDA